ncbi:MAG: type III-B CRISPR module RAMP protein Cmr4 [Thainema sp.]
MTNYLTYLYLLTPLHTGGSSNEGNLMGIAREVHTEFPYMPASSVRGRIRAAVEQKHRDENDPLKKYVQAFFGHKIEGGGQPTEGEVWFADATLLFFPIASLSHHLVWVTCPLWLERWSRWLGEDSENIQKLANTCRTKLSDLEDQEGKSAITSKAEPLYLQTALLKPNDIDTSVSFENLMKQVKAVLGEGQLISQLKQRLIVLSDQDCIALVEMGLQREVRVALKEDQKVVHGGSFRSEEAIPPEAVLFFPWAPKTMDSFKPKPGMKPEEISAAQAEHEARIGNHDKVKDSLVEILSNRLQFGGLEGLGRGWAELSTEEGDTNDN